MSTNTEIVWKNISLDLTRDPTIDRFYLTGDYGDYISMSRTDMIALRNALNSYFAGN